jgi:hypothetical protein
MTIKLRWLISAFNDANDMALNILGHPSLEVKSDRASIGFSFSKKI